MPETTPNLGIKKPKGNENVTRDSFNENWDIIDQNAAKKSDKGQPNGYACLDENGNIPVDQLGNIDVDLNADEIPIQDTEDNFTSTTIEGALNELFTNVSNGKNTVASAITDMGQSALGSDTFSALAGKIKDISDDANAGTGDVIAGKTFYQGGSKKTGEMPNIGKQEIIPGTSYKYISKGYHDGTGYVSGDPDLVAANIKSGKNIFNVAGSVVEATGTATQADVLTGKSFSKAGSAGLNGSMPNIEKQTIIPGTSTKYITKGYHNGTGYVVGDGDLVAANIKSGKNIFNVAGSVVEATGTATQADVLTGKTFSKAGSAGLSGSMPNIGTKNFMPSTSDQTIPAGKHSGSGKVYGDPDLVATNIKKDKNIFNVVGTCVEATGTATQADVLTGKTFSKAGSAGLNGSMPNIGKQEIIPGTSTKYISKGYHDGTGYVAGDGDLVQANIKNGKNIFGVGGSCIGIDQITGVSSQSITIESGESISAGDLVEIINGKVREFKDIRPGTSKVFESGYTYDISAVALSDSKVLVAYRDNNNSGYGTAIILSVSGTTITLGTAKVFESDDDTYGISAVALSDSKVLVAYKVSGYGKAIILSVNGTAITSGYPTVFESGETNVSYDISAVALSDSKVLVAYQDYTNSSYGTAIILSVSGTTITPGTAKIFESNYTWDISAVALSDSKVLVAYDRDYSNSSDAKAVILSISGTTITPGSPIVFESGSTNNISAVALSNSKVLVAYKNYSNSSYGIAIILSISGTTITPGSPTVFESGEVKYSISTVALSDSKVLVAYQDYTNSSYGTAIILSVSGTAITLSTSIVFESGKAWDISAVALSNSKVLLAYSDWDNSRRGTAIILDVPERPHGIANQSGSAGSTIQCYIW